MWLAASLRPEWPSFWSVCYCRERHGWRRHCWRTRVINAASDGYTLLFGTVGTHAYNQWIYKNRRYDAINDFTPVTLFSEQPMVLEARKDLPANDLREFIALLKSNGSKMQFGSAGAGTTTHLACALLNSKIGVNVTHVPSGALRPRRTT